MAKKKKTGPYGCKQIILQFRSSPIKFGPKSSVLSRAKAAISLDTGLAHMAAALNIPNVCLTAPFDPKHCGTYGHKQIHLTAKTPPCAPCIAPNAPTKESSDHQPACMASISPQQVLFDFRQFEPPGQRLWKIP